MIFRHFALYAIHNGARNMNKLNLIYIIYFMIGILLAGSAPLTQSWILASVGYVVVILSAIGYSLNGGK